MFSLRSLNSCLHGLVAGLIFLAACSSSTDSQTQESVLNEVASSTVPPSSTVPWQQGEEITAWNEFVTSYATLDVSEVSVGECGPRAMMITEESLTLYWWDGQRWNDDSQLLTGGRGKYPLKVYTHDYTNDGVLDFFVLYADEQRPKTQTYGSFFAYPWPQEELCEWRWMDVNNGRTTTKTLVSPDVNVQKGTIYGPGYTQRRTLSRGRYDFLPSTGAFVYSELVKK